MNDDTIEGAILEAERALEQGDPEAALAAASKASDAGLRAVVETRAFHDLGRFDAASEAHARAKQALGSDDLDVLELGAELALSNWELDRAREHFERLATADPEDAFPVERLALFRDFDGDHDGAHALLESARNIDSTRPHPVRIDVDTFAEVVDRALEGLPEPFASRLDGVRIVTEPMPFRELADPCAPWLTPPDLLGLFVGPTIHELAEGASAELPPTIYLFQRNLERAVASEDELIDEIRITLFHEFGHYLGLDEDEVAGMGLA